MGTATFNGTNYAKRATPVMETLVNGKHTSGNVLCMSEECYATGADLDAGSTMKIGKLPKGAVVLYTLVWPIDTATFGAPDAMSNAVTGSLGIAGDTDLFGAVTALNNAAVQTIAPKPDGATYTTTLTNDLQADVDVLFTTAGAALTATEGIAVKMFYVIR